MINNKRIGIALSGGGYRAAGFHLGTLKKLNELGLLDKADVLSTISGGSIVGAAYCLHKGTFGEFESKMISILSTKSVLRYVIASWRFLVAAVPIVILFASTMVLPFTSLANYTLLPLGVLLLLILKYQFVLLPLSKIIEKAYDHFFYHGATLSDLCKVPEIAINATNLQTIRHFTFSARKMEDTAYAFFEKPVHYNHTKFPVSRAVMASTCVPFAFSPVTIGKEFYKDPSRYDTVNPQLVDGGIYDNQGIHKLMQKNSSYACDVIIVSDAGNMLPFEQAYNNTFTLLLRTVEGFMTRIKNFQMMQSIFSKHHGREVAYLSLGWKLTNCIEGFYNNLKENNILAETLHWHEIPEDWIIAPRQFKSEILDHLSERLGFKKIQEAYLSDEQLEKIGTIGTSLTPIKKQLLENMIVHAALMTELQIKLYCPSIAKYV
jgi:NTE family protein